MTDASVLPPFIQQLDAIGSQIGNTPLFPIHHAWHKSGVQLYAKLEWYQLGKSACARSAYQIIRQAILTGKLDGETSILDATSGNMGIAYASIAAQLHIPLTLCIPEDAEQLDTGVVGTVFPDDAEKYTEVIHQIFNSSPNAIL